MKSEWRLVWKELGWCKGNWRCSNYPSELRRCHWSEDLWVALSYKTDAHPQIRWGPEERIERDADRAPVADFSGKQVFLGWAPWKQSLRWGFWCSWFIEGELLGEREGGKQDRAREEVIKNRLSFCYSWGSGWSHGVRECQWHQRAVLTDEKGPGFCTPCPSVISQLQVPSRMGGEGTTSLGISRQVACLYRQFSGKGGRQWAFVRWYLHIWGRVTPA